MKLRSCLDFDFSVSWAKHNMFFHSTTEKAQTTFSALIGYAIWTAPSLTVTYNLTDEVRY